MILFLVFKLLFAATWRPVVLMHGLLAGSEAMSHAQAWIEADFKGIYVKNVEIGNGRDDSMFMDINLQVENFAMQLKNDSKLKYGFNLIGHSQGGLLTRAYVERYNDPPVYNWISWAGPHQGVFGVPDFNAQCPVYDCPWLAILFDFVLDNDGWLSKDVQSNIAFAAYWHDPLDQAAFVSDNIFLADINNARSVKNQTYKANILSLNTAMLLYSTTDNIVVPKESPWFSFFDYVNGSDNNVVKCDRLPDWTEDWLGFASLYAAGKLQLHSTPCGHQDIPRDSCKSTYDKYTKPLLNNTL